MTEDRIKCIGWINCDIEHKNGKREIRQWKNTVLRKGKSALASSLTNSYGAGYNFFISRMIFGDGGTTAGVTNFVDTNRNGLYGITRASKPVVASVDPTVSSKAIFTSVLTYNDANGFALSEMALVMNTGDLYSLSTFPDLNKTESMQITWSWSLLFV